MDYSLWNSPGQNTGVGSLSLLQGTFPTQGSNPGLLHCGRILNQLSHKGSPRILEWVAYPFSSRSSQPRNRTGVPCIAGRFFTNWALRKAQCSVIVESNSLCFAWVNQWSWNQKQLHFLAETTWAEDLASSLLHLFCTRNCSHRKVVALRALPGQNCKEDRQCPVGRVYSGRGGNLCACSPVAQGVKNLPAVQETQEMQVWSLGREDPLEEDMATHSSILAWRIPWTEEPDGLTVCGVSKSQIWLSTHTPQHGIETSWERLEAEAPGICLQI